MSNVKPIPASRGRPPSTTHAAVEQVALDLFTSRGFDETTVDDIAAAIGVGRRTLFRYFSSKNDIVWGDFDSVLGRLRDALAETSPDEPVMSALSRAVVASNRYEPDQLPTLRTRMTLITSVPALQAHSMLRYAAWRQVVAEFVASRLGGTPEDLVAQTVAHAALGTSMAAFVTWVASGSLDGLEDHLQRAYRVLAEGIVTV